VDQANQVTVRGPKGQLEQRFPAEINLELVDNTVQVTRPTDLPGIGPCTVLSRAMLNNMVLGVSQGFRQVLDIEGVGYRCNLLGKNLVVVAGYSHPIEIVPPTGVSFDVDKDGDARSPSPVLTKQVVGEVAAQIAGFGRRSRTRAKASAITVKVIAKRLARAGKSAVRARSRLALRQSPPVCGKELSGQEDRGQWPCYTSREARNRRHARIRRDITHCRASSPERFPQPAAPSTLRVIDG